MSVTLRPGTRVHLVGVGGAGMSALAHILLERGHAVSGSDLRGGRTCTELAAMGAQVDIGHNAAHVAGAGLVAISSAVPEDNPEVAEARRLGLPLLRRAELLAALMEGRRGVLIAGTHGKTTTTSMATVCVQQAGLDPSFAIGGALNDSGSSAHHGSGEVFVAEADESDRSFLVYRPDLAVVTNVELDHHDAYASLEETLDVFAEFLARRPAGAPAVVCLDDDGGRALAARAAAPVVTYGTAEDAAVRITDVLADEHGSTFSLLPNLEHSSGISDERFNLPAGGRSFRLRVPGLHNVRNAAAAALAAAWAGAPLDAIAQGLESFSGAQRRFQRIGAEAGVIVVDDYAHHPTEIAATLAAARQAHPGARIVAAFQPHRYSRTAALGRELGAALAAADVLLVTDVYGSGEAPVPGVDGALVADAAREAGADATYVGGVGDLPAAIAERARPGDVVLTLGAGDITETGPVLLRLLEDSA